MTKRCTPKSPFSQPTFHSFVVNFWFIFFGFKMHWIHSASAFIWGVAHHGCSINSTEKTKPFSPEERGRKLYRTVTRSKMRLARKSLKNQQGWVLSYLFNSMRHALLPWKNSGKFVQHNFSCVSHCFGSTQSLAAKPWKQIRHMEKFIEIRINCIACLKPNFLVS